MTTRSITLDLRRAQTRSGRQIALHGVAALLAASLFSAPALAGGPAPPSADQHYQSARAAFLAGKVRFTDIHRINAGTIGSVLPTPADAVSLDDLLALDRRARGRAEQFAQELTR